MKICFSIKIHRMINIALFILIVTLLNGCATFILTQTHNVVYDSKPISLGKLDSIYINAEGNKLCLRYRPAKLAKSDEIAHLIIKDNGKHPFQVLEDIFSKPDVFTVKLLNLIAYRRPPSSLMVAGDNLGLKVFWDITDDAITFDNEKSAIYAKDLKQCTYDVEQENMREISVDHNSRPLYRSIYDKLTAACRIDGLPEPVEHTIRKLIRQAWLKKFGYEIVAIFFPVAWINQNGDPVQNLDSYTSNMPYPHKDIKGYVVQISPVLDGIKYVKVMLNPQVLDYVQYMQVKDSSGYTYESADNAHQFRAEQNATLEYENQLHPLSLNDVPIDNPSYCLTEDWKPLPLKKDVNPDLIYKTFARADEPYPLFIRILGAPLTVAFDVVTFPVQCIAFAVVASLIASH